MGRTLSGLWRNLPNGKRFRVRKLPNRMLRFNSKRGNAVCKRLLDLLRDLLFKLSKNSTMNKPYKEVFWLSYNGIMIIKQFDKKNKNYNNEQSNIKNSTNVAKRIQRSLPVSEINEKIKSEKERKFKLNKSKVRKRAISFSRLQKSRKNFYFYTITFPAQLNDNLCFDCLNIALTRLRKDNLINDYLWITERQKNTTLHFHLLTNDLFSVKILNNYIKSSLIFKHNRKEFEYERSKIENYNGVDIAKNRTTRKVINLALQKDNRLIISYLTKYITKNDAQFERLPFHSSHSISKLTHKYLIDQYEAQMIWDNHQATNQNPKVFKQDFCTLIFFNNEVSETVFEPIDKLNEHLYVLRSIGVV